MTIAEIMVCVVTIIVCGLGLAWMFYDLNKTVKQMEEAEAERCESLDADGDRE